MTEMYAKMFGTDGLAGWPTPSPHCEFWRHTTMERLVAVVDWSSIGSGNESRNYGHLAKSAVAAREHVLSRIEAGLACVSSGAKPTQIGLIVDKAVMFAVKMSLQRCRVRVTYPEFGHKIDRATMLPDPDSEDIDDGVVKFIVNLGLTKWGDAHGKNLDHRYDIVPALVHLRPADTRSMQELLIRGAKLQGN